VNFTSADHMDIPTTLIPSPHEQDEAQRGQQYKMHVRQLLLVF
jgi:cohesin complex subunit SCC1